MRFHRPTATTLEKTGGEIGNIPRGEVVANRKFSEVLCNPRGMRGRRGGMGKFLTRARSCGSRGKAAGFGT